MSTFTKVGILFGFVIAVQILVILVSKHSGTDKSAAFLFHAQEFNRYAQDKCAATLKENTKFEVKAPSGTDGDGKSRVTFTWRGGDASYDKIVCQFAKDKGVTNLTVDGKVIAATN